MARLVLVREWARETLWLGPAIGLLLAMALAVVTIEVDSGVEVGGGAVIGFGGGPDSARAILSTIAASMLTFLALVFTLTVVALQLASDFSPRLLGTFLSSRASKLALGLFVATFTFSVLVLREVSPETVPELSVTVAIALAIISVLTFVYYVSSIAQSLRVANIVEQTGSKIRAELGEAADRVAPGSEEQERQRGWSAIAQAEAGALITWNREPGVITALDLNGIRRLAIERACILELRAQVGDFLPGGAPVMAAYGGDPPPGEEQLRRLIGTKTERTFSQDPAFGIRQLVDIAARALSPGINDPTTASQALDQIHDVLLRLGSRALLSGVLRDEDEGVRVLMPVRSWEDYVHLAIDEIRLYGHGSMQVTRRLRGLLDDLERRLPETRRAAVREQLELLDQSVESGFANARDRRRARLAGIAPGGVEAGG